MEVDELLDRWRAAGLLTGSQAQAIRDFEDRAGTGSSPKPAPGTAPPEPKPEPEPASEPDSGRGEPRPYGRAERSQRLPDLPEFGLGQAVPAVDLRMLGTVLAALALLSLLGNIFAVTTDLFLGPGQQVATEVEDVFHLVASVLGLVGGLRIAGGRASGKGLVYWSLAINVVATVVLAGARLKQPLTVVAIAAWLILFALTWTARYRARYRYF